MEVGRTEEPGGEFEVGRPVEDIPRERAVSARSASHRAIRCHHERAPSWMIRCAGCQRLRSARHSNPGLAKKEAIKKINRIKRINNSLVTCNGREII